jgi:hypothetical protein
VDQKLTRPHKHFFFLDEKSNFLTEMGRGSEKYSYQFSCIPHFGCRHGTDALPVFIIHQDRLWMEDPNERQSHPIDRIFRLI